LAKEQIEIDSKSVKKGAMKTRLLFSVIIPTYIRPNQLIKCLEALLQQSLQKKEYEIIVVDNDSSGSAEEVVRKTNARGHRVRYQRRTSNNVSEARNLGARLAGGKWLAFVDDDCVAPVLWLERAKRLIHKNRGKMMVLGGDYLLPGKGLAPEYLSGTVKLLPGTYLPEGNLFMPRKLYLAFGGMNPELGPNEKRFGYHEGTDLQMRIEKQNSKAWPRILARELAVYHYQKPKNHLVTGFLSGLDLGRLKSGRSDGDLFYIISRIGWLLARLVVRTFMTWDLKSAYMEVFRIGEICGSFWPDKVNIVWREAPTEVGSIEIKRVRVVISRMLRLIARLFGVWSHAPIQAVRSEELGLLQNTEIICCKTLASQPVLPHNHPHLRSSKICLGQSWCASIKGATVYGPTVAVVDAQQRLLTDVSCEWGQAPELNWTMRRMWMPSTTFLKGKTLILAATGGESYYHWMMDVLPRIGLAKKNGFKLESFDHFVVNGIDKPFQQETLQTLGIPLVKCRVFEKRKKGYLCEEAVLPSMPGPLGAPPVETVKFLRSCLPASLGKGAANLFIAREKGQHRPLLESGEIWSGLKSLGFVQIDPGSMSVADQARAFRSARVIVGAHGAGLANIVFCRPGTRVIELFSPFYVNPCYRNLCIAAELLHGAVIGNGRDWALYLSLDQATAPITASWELLRKALKATRDHGRNGRRIQQRLMI
jgi:capsular polysaccharide biosynthesis protein/glycosyltransferase involved in cell wall biosynthesis